MLDEAGKGLGAAAGKPLRPFELGFWPPSPPHPATLAYTTVAQATKRQGSHIAGDPNASTDAPRDHLGGRPAAMAHPDRLHEVVAAHVPEQGDQSLVRYRPLSGDDRLWAAAGAGPDF
ncbi:hypothetical protein GCM10010187_13000 [Actinomadura coerulea]|nr:hypothetical protein GCM10010187_13000 [Actinomadura coerulea]